MTQWKPTKSPKIWTLRQDAFVVVLRLCAIGTQWSVYRRGVVGVVYSGWSTTLADFASGERGLVSAIALSAPPSKRPALLTFVPYGRRKYVESFLRRRGYADVKLPRRQGDAPFVLGEAGTAVVDEVTAHLKTIAPGVEVVG